MELGVSVIVCCFNSAERLTETIKHLALQKVPPDIPWEVIVVDNASTDDTRTKAKSEWDKYQLTGVEFKIVNEPIAGLSHARNKGIETAGYEYLLFCDDDNWLFDNYVFTAFTLMNTDSGIGVLGGCGIFEPEEPVWAEAEKFKTAYVNGAQTWAETDHWVYGAGSVYKKSVLTALKQKGWQQITTGRTGKKMLSGDDVEICFMTYLMGYKIIASDSLKFKHFVPMKRQNINYVLSLHYWHSYVTVLLNSYFTILNNDARPVKQVNAQWLRSATQTLIKFRILLIVQRFIKRKKATVEQIITLNSMRGTFWSLLKNREKVIKHHQLIKQILQTRPTNSNATSFV